MELFTQQGYFHLGSRQLTKKDLTMLCNVLRKWPGNITELSLNGNNIDDESAIEIAEMLETNNVAKNLWIPENPFTKKGVAALFTMLKKNTVCLSFLFNYLGFGIFLCLWNSNNCG